MQNIKLSENTISKDDINRLIEWLSTNPKLTMGDVTTDFEERFAKWIGAKYAIFVNSGSSANLLMLYSLIETGKLKAGDKVFVPALSWSTDLAPIIQLGLIPVLVDCNFDDLSINLNHLKQLINENKRNIPKALILVSALGNVPDMDNVLTICNYYNIILLEDNCESLGSMYKNKKLGNFGLMSSFSTYYGHHISTIEGGFVVTNDYNLRNILLMLRSHGWDRNLDSHTKEELRNAWNISEFESLYTFYYSGFNLRPTEIQAYIGILQMEKIDYIINYRNSIWKLYVENMEYNISSHIPLNINTDNFVSGFSFPVVVKHRAYLVESLNKVNVECRPLICGSLSLQPFYTKHYASTCKNAELISKHGLYVPIHSEVTHTDVKNICGIIKKHLPYDNLPYSIDLFGVEEKYTKEIHG